MKRTIWTPTFAWLGAVSVAIFFAFTGPSEVSLMGQLPAITAKRLDQQPVALPGQLPAERSLALVAYSRHQREESQSWIRGMGLEHDSAIAWFRLSVINDPGSEHARSAVEQ